MKQFSIDNSSYELDRTLSHRTYGTAKLLQPTIPKSHFQVAKKEKRYN